MKTIVFVYGYIILCISTCVYGGGTSQPTSDPVEQANSNWMMMGIGSGLCIILMILSLIAYAIHERQENTHAMRSRGVKYQNLSENPDNTIPHPIQWNEENYAQHSDHREEAETYTNPNNIIDMYARPQPKSLRNKRTKEIVNEPTFYSEVGIHDSKGCNDPKYAQVLPKNLRNTIKLEEMNTYANITSSSNYAEVLPKRQRKNKAPDDDKNIPSDRYKNKVPEPELNNSGNYSNIDNLLNYGKVVHNSNKYDNVFPINETYANVDSNSEMLEPAYCELNIETNL